MLLIGFIVSRSPQQSPTLKFLTLQGPAGALDRCEHWAGWWWGGCGLGLF